MHVVSVQIYGIFDIWTVVILHLMKRFYKKKQLITRFLLIFSNLGSFLLQKYFVNYVLKGHRRAAENNLNDLQFENPTFRYLFLNLQTAFANWTTSLELCCNSTHLML